MARSEISLGELILALERLSPAKPAAGEGQARQSLDAQTRADIVGILGVGTAVHVEAPPTVGAWAPSVPAPTEPPRTMTPAPEPEPPGPPRVSLSGEAGPVAISVLERLPAATFAPPKWIEPSDRAVAPAGGASPPNWPPPLFAPLRQRGLLSAMLSHWESVGDVDVDRVIDSISRLEPFESIPRLAARSMRRQVQLLLDRSQTSAPFRADMERLVGDLRDVVGRNALTVVYFAGSPLWGAGAGASDDWKPWRPPEPGVAVLVASTFGIVRAKSEERRATTRDWLAFAELATSGGARPIALVPFEPRRWPAALARAMILVRWSERAAASAVQRAMREALGGRR